MVPIWFYLALGGLIWPLTNKQKLEKEINSISNRLKNKDFIAKAPKKVVEENKIKIEDMMQNKERLSSSKELIKKLIK